MTGERKALVLAAALALVSVGCRQDMHNQPKYQPFEASELFPDGASSRTPVRPSRSSGTKVTPPST